jgi:hypothetical protein
MSGKPAAPDAEHDATLPAGVICTDCPSAIAPSARADRLMRGGCRLGPIPGSNSPNVG